MVLGAIGIGKISKGRSRREALRLLHAVRRVWAALSMTTEKGMPWS
jgi:hypothetical protein